MGAIFGIFAAFYFWVSKITGCQYPEWHGQVHFWTCAPLYELLSLLTECKFALGSMAIKHPLEPNFKEDGEKQGEKRIDVTPDYRKDCASYSFMDRLTNLNYYQRLSQEGHISTGASVYVKATEVYNVLTFCRSYAESSLPSEVSGNVWKKPNNACNDSKILTNLNGIARTVGLPNERTLYGNRMSVVQFIGRDIGSRLYSKGSPSPEISPAGRLLFIRERSANDPKAVFYDLIGFISKPETLTLAYDLIKNKPGNMTPVTDYKKQDSLNMEWVLSISKELKAGKFIFKPAPRVWSSSHKPGHTGPYIRLGISSPREAIVQKAILLVRFFNLSMNQDS